MKERGMNMDKDMYKPEYVTEFDKDGYHIVHSHYADRAEYEVYDNGRYIDVTESMAELSEITSEKTMRHRNDD